MNKPMTDEDVAHLSVADRLELMEQLWESLRAAPETVAMPDWHATELDRRLAAHREDPQAGIPWRQVRADILRKLGE